MGQFSYASVAAQQSIVMVNTGGPVAIQNLNHHVVMMLWGRMRGLKLQKARKDEMKNRKAKRLLLQRPVCVVELVISNHKIAVLHPFGQVAFAAKRKPTASQNRRNKGYAVR